MAHGPDSAGGHVSFDLYSIGPQRVLQKYVDLIKLPAFKSKDILHTDSNRTVILECEMAC